MEIIFLFGLLQALIVGAFCAYIAGQKNRSQTSWFVLGFLFSFLALLALVAVPKIEVTIYRSSAFTPSTPVDVNPTPTAERTCPFCAETVKAAAKICRFCQRDLPPSNSSKSVNDVSDALALIQKEKAKFDWSTKDENYCSDALKEAGFNVEFSEPNKWHISSPTGKSTSYAYSLKDLRRIAERETKL